MSNSARVAIIMSIYKSDSPEALSIALESLLKQTYSCDIFLYRDGEISLDLEMVVERYKHLNAIYYFESDENKGLAKALNFLIGKVIVTGYEYIARMDSDDVSKLDRIEQQVEFLEENDTVDVCGSFCHEFGASYALEVKSLPLFHEDLLNFSVSRCPFIHPTVMFRASVFSEGCRYPESTVLTEDMALWFALLEKGYKFANLDKVLLDYRLTENTIFRRKGFRKALSEIAIRLRYMFLLNQISVKNTVLILSRIVFHLLPSKVMKFAYKNAR